jgi:hypothetical protein
MIGEKRETSGFNLVTQAVAEVSICPAGRAPSKLDLTCKGAGCMAWRWNAGGDAGYCGMAGRPLDRADAEMFAAVINEAMFGERGPSPELIAFDLPDQPSL